MGVNAERQLGSLSPLREAATACKPAIATALAGRGSCGQLVQVVASSRGGGAVHVRALSAGLAQRGLPVTVIMPLDGGHLGAEDFTAAGVRFVAWYGDNPLRAAVSLAETLRDAPALVHAHGSRAAVLSWVALRLARLRRTPLLCSVHGFVTPFHRQPRRVVQRTVERAVARRCAAVVAVSDSERAALLSARIAPPDKIVTIPQGVELTPFTGIAPTVRPEARRALGIDPATFAVVTVCRLDRPRDFDTLLRALSGMVVRHRDTLLMIVGEGPRRSEVEALAHRFAVEPHVRLFGLRRDLVPFLAAADAFVLTSDAWEALGIATVEAQAAALPVIVTDAGGAAEAFRPGISGVLVPPRNPAALAAALFRLASDGELRAQMGAAGRVFVGERFRVDAMVESMQRLYQAVQGDVG